MRYLGLLAFSTLRGATRGSAASPDRALFHMLTVPLAFALALLAGTSPKPSPPIMADLYFGAKGPYHFLVDTGAECTTVDPKLASEIGIEPTFRTEIVNMHGSRLAPGARLNTLRVGRRSIPDVEVLIDDPVEARRVSPLVRGILGSNVLNHFDFMLLPRAGTLEVGIDRPVGVSVPFTLSNGRILLRGQMGTEALSLIFDSGASHVVLFRTPAAMAKTPPVAFTLTTLEGARTVVPTTWTADIVFNDRLRLGSLPAGIVELAGTKIDGLLPAAIFSMVFVDQSRRELVVAR